MWFDLAAVKALKGFARHGLIILDCLCSRNLLTRSDAVISNGLVFATVKLFSADLALRITTLILLAASGKMLAQSGFVRSAGQPIPGATVTATQGTQTVSTITDADGHYSFPPLGAGSWSVRVEMFGFDPLQTDVIFATAKAPVNFDLTLREPAFMRRMRGGLGGSTAAGGPGSFPGNSPGSAGARSNGMPSAPTGGRGNAPDSQSGADANGLDADLQNELNSDSSGVPRTNASAGQRSR